MSPKSSVMVSGEPQQNTLSWDDDDAIVIGRDDVSDFNPENILPESIEVQQAIRRWLEPTSYDAGNGEFNKHLASYLPGTGQWLLDSSTFHEWHDSNDQGMLWVKGIPGSGKSVIAASLVNHLSKEGAPVLYFFFRQIIDANHTPDALLRDWLAQLLIYTPPLQTRLKEYKDKNRSLSSVSMSDMWLDLKAAMVHLPKVYCVVDALDEMDNDRDSFLQALAEFGRWRPSRVKVIITSRPVPKVEKPLRREPILQIRLDEEHVDGDIASYVVHRLGQSSKEFSIQEQEVIKKTIPGRANGLFLYAKLAMDAFLEEDAQVEEVLKTLPLDLNVMYTGLLREHARRSGIPHDLQILILSFVTHASRPLRLIEIAEIIKEVGETQSKELDSLEAIKDFVRAACGPLLEIIPDETVCVIHHSLTEFLNGTTRSQESHDPSTDYPILDINTTHNRLALCCISYLLNGCLDKVKMPDDDDYEEDSEWVDRYYVMPTVNKDLHLSYPFLAYSMKNWHVHARKADCSGPLSEELDHAVSKVLSGQTFQALALLLREGSSSGILHNAAGFGLSQYVSRLIGTGNYDIDAFDASDRTPIFYAAWEGHASVVKVLLENGAKPDEPSHNGTKPLHVAASSDRGEVVELLLAAGVDPLTKKTSPDPGILCGDLQKTVGQPPLMYAMSCGSLSAAKAFLPYLKTAEIVNKALFWAAGGRGHGKSSLEIIEAILQHPLVDVNAIVRGVTPLYLVALEPDTKSIMTLLKAGSDPSIVSSPQRDEFSRKRTRMQERSKEDRTALHALCGSRRYNGWCSTDVDDEPEFLLECFHMMLDSGVDINAQDKRGLTALHYAARLWPNLVRALLKAGADPNITKNDGDTPLHGCTNAKSIRILVDEGNADINKQRDSDGKTPFLSIAKTCSADLVRLYVDLGADLTLAGHDGKGAIHIAVSEVRGNEAKERLEALQTLLTAGVPIDIRDHQGKTAMHYLKGLGDDYNLALRLVSAGVDLNARDNLGRTPLFYFVQEGCREYSRDLDHSALGKFISLGARIDVIDYKGFNLLFGFAEASECRDGGSEIIEELIERGLDPKAQDYEGNTLFHELVARTTRDFTGRVLKIPQTLGVDPDQQNYAGQTALHFMMGLRARDDTTDDGLKFFKKVDVKDNDGIRPLHVAARSADEHIQKMLSLGASPTEATLRGVTPLHVAARFRKSEIVGILLEAIEAISGKEGVIKHLNMFQGPEAPSALHLACRSGVPETVARLLEAGADPNAASSQVSSPLEWCLQYESELELWQVKKDRFGSLPESFPTYPSNLGVGSTRSTRGINFGDSLRQNDEGTPTQLEDILDMLHAHGADLVTSRDEKGQTNLDKAISKCDDSYDYTMECLVRLRQRLEQEDDTFKPIADLNTYVQSLIKDSQGFSEGTIQKMTASIWRRAASREAFRLAAPWSMIWSAEPSIKPMEALIDSLIKQHDWDSISHTLQQGPRLINLEEGHQIVSKLVRSGLRSVLQAAITREEVRRFQQEREEAVRRSDAEGKRTLTRQQENFYPLFDACYRPSGSMPMLRFLVEDLGVDPKYEQGRSAVAECCRDGWWQVAEGLPYLIKQGVDIESRDSLGRTALHWALDLGSPTYKLRVVQILIEAGADVHAIDNDGNNCLYSAGGSAEAALLLLNHGATPSIKSLAQAIEACNRTVIEASLDSGANPNGYYQGPESLPAVKGGWIVATKTELPPVFLAAMHHEVFQLYRRTTLENQVKVVQIFLRHGANPFATFIKRVAPDEGDFMKEVMVLHQLLRQGGVTQPFLELPNLDLEHRDSEGMTLLLAACGSVQDPDISSCDVQPLGKYRNKNAGEGPTRIEVLLGKGASLEARDNLGRNAIHHLVMAPTLGGYESLRLILRKAPELLNQTDAFGETPFHYALKWLHLAQPPCLDIEAIEILLEAGADFNQADAKGDSALHHVAKWLPSRGPSGEIIDEPRELFKRFVSLGLLVNGRNKDEETPAFSLLRHMQVHPSVRPTVGQNEALEFLLNEGADFCAVNKAGDTTLHATVGTNESLGKQDRFRDEELVAHRFRWLLDQGVDPMAENLNSRTSLDIAAAKEYSSILDMFKRPV